MTRDESFEGFPTARGAVTHIFGTFTSNHLKMPSTEIMGALRVVRGRSHIT